MDQSETTLLTVSSEQELVATVRRRDARAMTNEGVRTALLQLFEHRRQLPGRANATTGSTKRTTPSTPPRPPAWPSPLVDSGAVVCRIQPLQGSPVSMVSTTNDKTAIIMRFAGFSTGTCEIRVMFETG